MDFIPNEIFKDLMIDLVGKYKGPPIAPSDVQDLPLSEAEQNRTDSPDEELYACEPDLQIDYSSLSTQDDSHKSDSPTDCNNQSSTNQSQSQSSGFTKDSISPEHLKCDEYVSPNKSPEQIYNNKEPSHLNSRKETSSLKHTDHGRSGSPSKSKKQDSNNRSVSSSMNQRKNASSLKHASHRQSRTPVECKGQTSDSRSGLRGRDYKKDNHSSGHSKHRQSRSPTEIKKEAPSSRSETRSSRGSHKEDHASHSSEKKKNVISDNKKGVGSVSKGEAALGNKIEDKIRPEKGDNNFQTLKDKINDPNFLVICGEQLIKWVELAKEHDVKSDLVRSNLYTETFRNLITAFKCRPTSEHHKHFFSKVGEDLCHPAFQRPSLDSELLAMFHKGNNSEAREFLKKIYPLDKDLEKIQYLIMKATIPLFLICNAYEVGSNATSPKPDLRTTVLPCRLSLVLLGQIFCLISSLRQERVLEALGVHGKPPQPSQFPNLDSGCLFGKDYMAKLDLFMKKSLLPRKDENTLQANSKDVDPQVDAKTQVSIEKLARFVAEMGLGMEAFNIDKLASNPNFWFLNADQSPAYKLYQTKLAEFRKLFNSSLSDTQQDTKQSLPASPQPFNTGGGSSANLSTDCFTAPLLPPPRKRRSGQNDLPVPTKKTVQDETLKVDAKTRDAAETLARFVVTMGPEMERFTMAEASKPEFWFLNHKDHPAYKFYHMKLTEFSKAKQAPSDVSSPKSPVQTDPDKTNSTSTGSQNSTGQTAEPQSALLLLAELYDSDEEDSQTEDNVSKNSRHQSSRHHKSRSRTDSASRDTRWTSSRRDSRSGIRLL
ncbi:SURP and G-patch domain-containing protein 2-like [Pleurodeles waltl]|uniref:SURP and G-patch domain-containing protein 2-like n=1 Tax=Pleurodeles waltl TaxID=8319 RepID=UPI003709C0FD